MKRLRVMIVDDDAIIAFLLGEILKGMGHDVCASEGTQDGAIAAALGCKPDLMIVDERLGGGSGMRVVDVVCMTEPVPHVFVSGDIQAIERLRPNAVTVAKPYSEADLACAIQKAMSRRARAAPGPAPPPTPTARSTPSPASGADQERSTTTLGRRVAERGG